MLHQAKLFLVAVLTVMFCCTVSDAAILQGTVKTFTGTPLSGVTVQAYGVSTGDYQSSITDVNGHYLFDNLTQGQYSVHFNAAISGYYDHKWYGNATCGYNPAITVTTNQVADMTFGFQPGTGVIRGTVTDRLGNRLGWVTISTWPEYLNYAFTDANGEYSLTLPVGNHLIYFTPIDQNLLMSEVYDNVTSYNYFEGRQISVTPNSVFVANAVLEPPGTLSGTVRDAAGAALSRVLVQAYDAAGLVVGSAYSDANGAYRIGSLFTGSYKVFFEIENTGIATWYGNKTTIAAATPVSVTAGANTANLDAVLEKGSIAGQVTDRDGVAMGNIMIRLVDAAGKEIASTTTAQDGSYRFDNLRPGGYRVFFQAYAASRFMSEWYNDRAMPDADSLQVNAGMQSVANAVLGPYGSITGRVTDAGGTALAGVTVSAYGSATGETAGTATTDSSGNYRIELLVPGGTYKVRFSPSAASGYLTGWYSDRNDFFAAQPVTVAAGGVTGAVNAVLVTGAVISGKLSGEGGLPLQNATAKAAVPGSGTVIGTALTDAQGNYTIKGLPTGSYQLSFSATGYIREYYNDMPGSSSAHLVTATAPLVTPGIDAALARGGSIGGRVTSSYPVSRTDVTIYLYDAAGALVASSVLNGTYGQPLDLAYKFGGLPTGSYKVRASQDGAELWYNQASAASASPVAVAAPGDVLGIDLHFNFGKITGSALDFTDCEPVSAASSVCAFDSVTGKSVRCSYVDSSSSSYEITLLPGNYKVRFYPFSEAPSGQPIKWYGGASLATAQSVAVQAAQTTTGINMTYSAADLATGTLTGRATDQQGRPVAGTVALYDLSNALVKSVEIDFMGNYRITGVAPGSYKLNAAGANVGHYYGSSSPFSVWSGNKPDFASATGVSVAANSSVEANFTAIAYRVPLRITAASGSGGTIFPSGTTTVAPGGSLTMAITPASGYQVADVLVDGVSVGAPTSYSFVKTTKDCTIAASFIPIPQQPAAPAALAATGVTAAGCTANWSAVAGATRYYLDLSVSPEFAGFVAGFSNREVSGVTSFAVGGLAAGTTYYYRVRAYSGGGTSASSNTVSLATLQPVNGACGPANGQAMSAAPSTGLCSAGTAGTVSGTGPWSWSCAGAGGGSNAGCVAGMQTYSLAAVLVGSGGGSVNSVPSGLACSAGSCQANYPAGTSVTLHGSPNSVSVFAGWTGACTNPARDCTLTLTADRSVTATFNVAPNARIGSTGYASLAAAHAAAADGAEILLLATELSENLMLSRGVGVRLKGGYLPDYSGRGAHPTILNGTLAIRSGSIKVDGLALR